MCVYASNAYKTCINYYIFLNWYEDPIPKKNNGAIVLKETNN